MERNKRVRVLFNCTTNIAGGGIQNAANFIKLASEDDSLDYIFAVSNEVDELLIRFNKEMERYIFKNSPSQNWKERRRLASIAGGRGVDLVYTMAGPSYVSFEMPHIMGISEPYLTHGDCMSIRSGRTKYEMCETILRELYKSVYVKRADYWIFQTEMSRRGFCKRFMVDKNKTVVISNALGFAFTASKDDNENINRRDSRTINVFCPGYGYPHKALHIIPGVVKALMECDARNEIKFILTIERNSRLYKKIQSDLREIGKEGDVCTIGPYSYADAYELYNKADIVFVPSILETFSTVYLEAMAMNIPMVVADREFSREICGDYPRYCKPLSRRDAARAILNVIASNEGNIERRRKASKQLIRYGNYKSRYRRIRETLERVSRGDNLE